MSIQVERGRDRPSEEKTKKKNKKKKTKEKRRRRRRRRRNSSCRKAVLAKNVYANARRCLASQRQEGKERVEWPLGIHTNAQSRVKQSFYRIMSLVVYKIKIKSFH